MIYYVFLVFLPLDWIRSTAPVKIIKRIFLLVLLLFYVLFIGGRFEVGVDWFNYEHIYENNEFSETFSIIDILNSGYKLLVLIGNLYELKYIEFNLIVAFIALSFFYLALKKSQFVFIQIAFIGPYLFNLICMNYVRQSLTVSVLFLLVYYRSRLAFWFRSFLDVVAFSFHPSFVIMMIWNHSKLGVFLVSAFIALIVSFFVYLSVAYVDNYIIQGMESAGAWPRFLVYSSPFIIQFLLRIPCDEDAAFARKTGTIISSICFLFLVSGFSTVCDRLGVYMLPMASLLVAKQIEYSRNSAVLKILYPLLGLTLFVVWSHYSYWSDAWFPYRNWIFE